MKQVFTSSVSETEEFAARFAKLLRPGNVIAFYGDLGVGKTAFVRGLAKGMGNDSPVSSPTFAIVNDYGGIPPLVHFDMYRVSSWEDLNTTGFFDYLDMGAILAVEWSENIENALPPDVINIKISRGDSENERTFQIWGETLDENLIN